MSRAGWPEGAWSTSRFSTLRRCPKAHHLKYTQRISPLTAASAALLIGTAFHRGRELVAKLAAAGEPTGREQWAEAIALAAAECESGPASVEAVRLLRAYESRYGATNAGYGSEYTVLSAEQVFAARDLHRNLGGFAAIADAKLRRNDGRLVVVEIKTASRSPAGSIEEAAAERKTWDQALALAYCVRDVEGEIPLILYDVAVKTTVPKFVRIPVEVTAEDLARWAEEHAELEQLVTLRCANRDSCAPPVGYRCDYFDYCHGDALDRERLYEIRPSREPSLVDVV